MKFKDYLPADNITMLNLDEFAEYIELDNVIIRAMILENTSQKSGNRQLNYTGLHGDFTEIFFRTCDYTVKRGRIPKHGEISCVRGKRYTVDRCEDEQGMCHLILSAYRQNTVNINAFNIAEAKGLI